MESARPRSLVGVLSHIGVLFLFVAGLGLFAGKQSASIDDLRRDNDSLSSSLQSLHRQSASIDDLRRDNNSLTSSLRSLQQDHDKVVSSFRRFQKVGIPRVLWSRTVNDRVEPEPTWGTYQDDDRKQWKPIPGFKDEVSHPNGFPFTVRTAGPIVALLHLGGLQYEGRPKIRGVGLSLWVDGKLVAKTVAEYPNTRNVGDTGSTKELSAVWSAPRIEAGLHHIECLWRAWDAGGKVCMSESGEGRSLVVLQFPSEEGPAD